MLTNPSPLHRTEAAGFLLSLAFARLAAVRDVYFGGLFQRVNPLGVALVAFGLGTLGFLPLALARDRRGLAVLVRRPGRLVWINVTTALAWLSFFFALRTIEPAVVQVLFYGIGPLSVRWLDGRVPGSLPTTLTPLERRLHLALSASLAVAGAVVLAGLSGLGAQPVAAAVVGVALAVGGVSPSRSVPCSAAPSTTPAFTRPRCSRSGFPAPSGWPPCSSWPRPHPCCPGSRPACSVRSPSPPCCSSCCRTTSTRWAWRWRRR